LEYSLHEEKFWKMKFILEKMNNTLKDIKSELKL
jgi:hypothetical protein